MAKIHFWIVVIIVAGFIGFMIGYAVPPFMEVGFGKGQAVQQGVSEEELMKQYQQILEEGGGGESE